jgi:hypothetical protein
MTAAIEDLQDTVFIRGLTNGPWSSVAVRDGALIPLMERLSDWSAWGDNRQLQWAEKVITENKRQIFSEIPCLTDEFRQQCRDAKPIKDRTQWEMVFGWGRASLVSTTWANECMLWVLRACLVEPDRADEILKTAVQIMLDA